MVHSVHMRSFALSSFVFLAFLAALPLSASAATAPAFEVSGWIPYWRTATGTADVFPHLDQLTEVNPFVYTIKSDGTLVDNGPLDQDPWKSFIVQAKAKKVRVIPSIMTSNGDLVHEILSDKKKRKAHEDAIVKLVKQGGFDGIDLDYEGKLAETRPYFTLFIKELYAKLGNKWLMCTIEARTPAEDRFLTVPQYLEYANDFKAMNKYCDRVRFMTYDQGRIDLKLNASSTEPYVPIADTRWVEKTIKLAKKDIAAKKIVIGVATYGYEYDLTIYGDGYEYDRLWAFNPGYALQAAAQYHVQPARNQAGEMHISYVVTPGMQTLPAPDATSSAETMRPVASSGVQLAAAAMALASSTNTHATMRYATWSDAGAIAEKIALAKKLGVRGVAIFKLDGGEDQGLWGILPARKK